MAFPKRIGFMAVGANTRTLIAKDKETKPHPVTGAPIVTNPPVFVTFPGARSLFMDDATMKFYRFKDLRQFFGWIKTRAEIQRGEIVYSACLDVPLQPVARMGVAEVEEELRKRMLVGEKDPVAGSVDEKRDALLELRRVAGESVPEPKPQVQQEVAVPAPAGDEAERLVDDILGSLSKGR